MLLNKFKKTVSVVVISSLFFVVQSAFAGVVITNKATNLDFIESFEVKALFMKKKKTFSNGVAVEVADQTEDSPVREEFTKVVIGKKPKKLKKYWSKRIFAGKGTPPKALGGDAEMLEWVAKTPNSLGYVSSGAVNDTVKVLLKY